MEIIGLLFFALIAISGFVLSRPSVRGAIGEKKVQVVTGFLLSDEYRRIDNVILPIRDGTTQIDHVIISVYGVFVVETKNMKGWIFGDAHQREWTQVLFSEKFRFQNPLRQNYLHCRAVQSLLRVPRHAVHSVVVFSGEADFRTEMPENVMHIADLSGYIRSFRDQVFSREECESFVRKIEHARLPATAEASRQHRRNLRQRFSAQGANTCPRCGGKLVVRSARQGQFAGNNFLGCSGYPSCKYTRDCS